MPPKLIKGILFTMTTDIFFGFLFIGYYKKRGEEIRCKMKLVHIWDTYFHHVIRNKKRHCFWFSESKYNFIAQPSNNSQFISKAFLKHFHVVLESHG